MSVEVVEVAVPSSLYGFCGRKATFEKEDHSDSELRSCVKVEVGSPSLIIPTVSVNVKQH